MPYINKQLRNKIDDEIEALAKKIGHADASLHGAAEGMLNYTITRLLLSFTWPLSYRRVNMALGILEAVKLELYRRVAAPYEDQKRDENGEVY